MKIFISIFVLLIFSILGIKALFHTGLFTAHDIWHQVVRFYYYSKSIDDGQFPPFWVGQLANHFGYPLYGFSYHFPWLIGVLLLKLGLDISGAIRWLFIISYIGSSLAMFVLVNTLLKDRLAALLSSILYIWLPYHFLIIFVGASMGTSFIFLFLPLILLGIYLCDYKQTVGITTFALSFAGIALSQIMNLVFLFPLILIFSIWKFNHTLNKKVFIKNVFLGLSLGLLLSSYYLLPAAFYQHQTRFHLETGIGEIYKRNFINLKQLIYSKWGYSPIINNAKAGEISFQLGIAQWISILLVFILLAVKKVKKNKDLTIYLLISFIVCIFLTNDLSKPIWELIIKYAALDFPFRFILPASFAASLIGGIVLINFGKKVRIGVFSLLVIISLYTNRNHINVNEYTNFPISSYLSIETEITTNTYHEYLPILANSKLFEKPWNEIIGDNLVVKGTKQTTKKLSFEVSSQKKQIVSLGQFYFPGQTLFVDKIVNRFDLDREGRISFELPEGNHSIKIEYQQTKVMKFSKLLSLMGILLLSFIILWHKKQVFYHKK
jgi:hypothetical protein